MTVRQGKTLGGRARWIHALGMSIAGLLPILIIAGAGPAESRTACGSIQTRVDNAAAGTVVDLPDGCVYRETVTIKKSLTLKGGPGVEIRGSNVWTGWTKGGGYWTKGKVPKFSQQGTCKPGTNRCRWPAQVFLDSKPLLQVASKPKPGQFAVDSRRRIIIANDPRGHTLEVTIREYWVEGRSDNVTVDGFAMKHAANMAQSGAIKNNEHDNWAVKNNNLSYAHGANVAMGAARGLEISGNDIHHGGWLGIAGNRADLEVRNNEVHHNNTEGFDPRWAAGGMKTTRMIRLMASGNEVYENDWVGFWSDGGSENVTYSNNRVHHNDKVGIHLEISDRAKIFANTIWRNGWGVVDGSTGEESGIKVVASRDVEVYNNTLAWNNDGVSVVNTDRRGNKYDMVRNVKVHHNTILATDNGSDRYSYALHWRKAYEGGNIYKPVANNRGYDNRYWYPRSEGSRRYRFRWDSNHDQLTAFNRTLGEERGRYLSEEEKGQIIASEGVLGVSGGQEPAPTDE